MNTEQSAYLEAFFKAHFSELQVHAFRFLEDWGSAKIAVMDAFEIACEKMDVFSKKANQINFCNMTGGLVKKYNKQHQEPLPHITPHSFRHTFCTRMANAGMNPAMLQYIMGHNSITMTLGYYTHVNVVSAKAEMDRITAKAKTDRVARKAETVRAAA